MKGNRTLSGLTEVAKAALKKAIKVGLDPSYLSAL
jgi:hypothetical protein